MDNKRKHERIKTNIKSEVHSEESMTFSNSIDMSRGGVFISTPEPLKEGSEVILSLQIPGQEQIEVKGIVKWMRDDDSEDKRSGMGIEFVNISEQDSNVIKKITKK